MIKVAADLPAGKVDYCHGHSMANVDSVDITIHGVGGHGASSHVTKDPIGIAAQVILALQTIVSREIKPTESAVITIGSIHSEIKHNIIPDKAHLQLTVRSYSDKVRNQLITAIKRITNGIAQAAGIPKDKMPTITIQDNYTPFLYNDSMLTERLVNAFQTALGKNNVVSRKPNVIKLRDRFISKSVSPLMKPGFSGKSSPWPYRDNRPEEQFLEFYNNWRYCFTDKKQDSNIFHL